MHGKIIEKRFFAGRKTPFATFLKSFGSRVRYDPTFFLNFPQRFSVFTHGSRKILAQRAREQNIILLPINSVPFSTPFSGMRLSIH